jgi:hypothetical protein
MIYFIMIHENLNKVCDIFHIIIQGNTAI